MGVRPRDLADRMSGRHSVGDNSSNFFSAASYTLTWSIGNSALRSLALFVVGFSLRNGGMRTWQGITSIPNDLAA
jgi:hypothetical protein